MDLIYTDSNGVDVGVINFYDFDLAFGRDENDFQLTMPLVDHCMEIGNMIYVDNTEYGGIVDAIKVDIKSDKVIYSGRTWHGLLNSKVVDYEREWSGSITEAIAEVIDLADLGEMFHVKHNPNINMFGFSFTRFRGVYDTLTDMMEYSHSKLVIRYNGNTNKIDLSVENRIDYVNDDYFDSDEIDFTAQKSLATNHIICIMSNDTEEKRIDIFTDENGIVQPYQKSDSLIDENRYYLDKSQQVLFGKDEIVEVMQSGIDIRNSYHAIESYPNDWVSNFESYFHRVIDPEGNVSYEQNQYIEKPYYIKVNSEPNGWEANWQDYFTYREVDNEYISASATNVNIYNPLENRPDQWDEEYNSYYYKDGTEFKSVEGIDDVSLYEPLPKEPNDWKNNYASYFERIGTNTFQPVTSTENKPNYELVPERPTDWETNPSNYWYNATKYKQINANGQIIAIEDGSTYINIDKYYAKDGSGLKTRAFIPNYEPLKYYTKELKPVAPKWILGKHYSKKADALAPTWQANTYYYQTTEETPPTFVPNKYYERRAYKYASRWIFGQYFIQQNDNYIIAIENAISHLNEQWGNADSLDIDLPTIYNYDIGDVVGATEHITNLEVAQLVTKKIVKITNGIISISYEIGKEK